MFTYSIIIPHYNIPDLLERCLNTIPKREDLEIIVVDDYSIIKPINFKAYSGLKRDDVRYLYNSKNMGAGFSRNLGIQSASGKWILFVDADDFLLPNAFQYIDQHKESEDDVILFKAETCVSANVSEIGNRVHAHFLNQLIDNVLTGRITAKDVLFDVLSPWCKLVKRDFILSREIFFHLTKLGGEDLIWSSKLAIEVKKMAVADAIIYCVTERPDSLTKQNDLRSRENAYKILLEKNRFLKLKGVNGHNSYFPYSDLMIIANHSKIKYVKYMLKGLLEGMYEPKNFYAIEKKLKFKYPYIYMILGGMGFPSLSRYSFLKALWQKIC
jgi:glycosyltransferase involved in cell wall biosynthesis